jgi:hypothetical protein
LGRQSDGPPVPGIWQAGKTSLRCIVTCPAMAPEPAAPSQVPIQISDTRRPSRGGRRPRFAFRCPSNRREQGMPDARCCTHGPVCKGRRKRTRAYRFSGEQSDIPCAMALRLMTRSPRSIGLSCLRRLPETGTLARLGLAPPQDLTPTTEASGPTRLHRTLQHRSSARPVIAHGSQNPPCSPIARTTPPRPPHPIPTFGDDGQRPFLGDRMAGVLKVICPTAKAKFCPSG